VGQDLPLFDATVAENVAYGAPWPVTDDAVRAAARRADADTFIRALPAGYATRLGDDGVRLSGGQRQRVAVGRAIVRKPQVFLFDEPLSNLDAKLRVQTRIEISKLHRRLETTMIYVTHDQIEAMTMGDRIVVMKDGLVQQIDTPLNLYHVPLNKFVAGFIGSPAMNFMPGKIIRNGGLKFKHERFEVVVPKTFETSLGSFIDQEVVFGIRPEDIHLAGDTQVLAQKVEVAGEVEVVEPMGSEIFLYANLGATNLVARITSRTEPPIGSQLPLTFDLSKSHFFSAQSEESLRPA
jgi:multiple sugar transport system ATP-binding protein